MESATPQLALSPEALTDLYRLAQAAPTGLDEPAFAAILATVGARTNFGLPPGQPATAADQTAFLRTLNLIDLALAHACAQGHDPAWKLFLDRFRDPLLRFGIKLTRSASLGQDLADAAYSELYGLNQAAGQRKSPLASYSGRGALLVWLRATLAQRHVDRHRRQHREQPLDDREEFAAPTSAPIPAPELLATLTAALGKAIAALSPDDRLLLASYFLDQSTLDQIALLTGVHKTTVMRKLKRLTTELNAQLLQNLQSTGLSLRAAQEALGTDPRDLSVNLRQLLQSSAAAAFPQVDGPTGSEPS